MSLVADSCPKTAVYNTMLDGDVIPLSVDGATVTVECGTDKELPDGVTTMYYTTCEAGVWNDTRSCGK